jgi:hypothetical protein
VERKIRIPTQPGGKPADAFEVPIRESTERWTEVTLEDGAIIRLKPTIIGFARIDGQWDLEGNPIYVARGAAPVMALVSVPDHLKKPEPESGTVQGKAN